MGRYLTITLSLTITYEIFPLTVIFIWWYDSAILKGTEGSESVNCKIFELYEDRHEYDMDKFS